jgi:hypothetical protein
MVFLLLFLAAFLPTGCKTLYRKQIYHPYKSNYQKPPEKRDAAAELLPEVKAPEAGAGGLNAMPGLPEAGGLPGMEAPAAIPGMLDAPPAIPGLPQ